VNLLPQNSPAVSLVILMSLDEAEASLGAVNQRLLALGVISLLACAGLAFFISGTFTRPLENLVGGVRALEKGDFDFPLHAKQGDEVAEVTGAFDRMRVNLRKTQNEQKDLAERLRQAHKMEAVGRLAGGIAHDFNNLLTVIRGHGDILSDRPAADDVQKRSVDQIRKAADRAATMTRQLLAFSRMQVLQPRVLDLNEIVASMAKMLPSLIGEHIEFSIAPAEKLAAVKADPGQIEQVIMNLAVNARDAMPAGGKLTVRTANIRVDAAQAAKIPTMQPGDFVLLSVADTGHGMSEETKAHIFEPFFTTKEQGKGTGLGLATVYGVVKQSGGYLSVESSPGNGATFQIFLPQVADKAVAIDLESKPKSVPRGSETILVVEDEAAVRELACQFLSVKGYNVLEAKDGFDALDVAARHTGTIHLVLSDMVMPKMNGTELAEKMKKARPDAKILLMSGYYEYSETMRVITASTTPILQKPFSPASLVARVQEVLSGAAPEKNVEAPIGSRA
jgi:two-component system, cell cycle sensor histidine kinase and response regulator CckA